MNYRSERNYENANKALYAGVGQYGIPQIEPMSADSLPRQWLGFNYAKTARDATDKGLHFFVDDYQFLRVWDKPDIYLDMLRRFGTVCTPDFSTYVDFPKALQIYNHYRKHWLGAYWQENGINVIPSISWSDADSYEWCFDGEPQGGVVAISSVGTQSTARSCSMFLSGYYEMLKRIKPAAVLFYGEVPAECEGAAHIIPVQSFQKTMRKRIDDGKNAGGVV